MPFTKDKKKQMLDELEIIISQAKSAIFTEYRGTKVAKVQELRKELRENDVKLKVVKNTLLKKVLEKHGLTIDQEILDKPIAMAVGVNDEVAPAKLVNNKSKEVESLVILGGLVNGEFYNASQIKALADMPSREQMQAQVVGTIAAPLTGFVNVLSGNLRGLINVLNAYKEKINK